MLSDLRIVAEPLDKWSCRRCALISRRRGAGQPGAFASGYRLYDHAPGPARETHRQQVYAEWIERHAPRPPQSVLDVGCGNGSLLLALKQCWPDAAMRGLDASAESVARARAVGLDAIAGAVEELEAAPADLVVSVNVLEHTPSPERFLSALRRALSPAGMMIVICPDATRPWSELVIADHRWSLTTSHLRALVERSGFRVTATAHAPAGLGPFQMVVATGAGGRGEADALRRADPGVWAARRDYLERWRRLDDVLVRRAARGELVCFGTGEAAGLLRAYAPRTWSRVTACIADRPEQQWFDELPVMDYASGSHGPPVLLGVRPAAQRGLADRLQADGRVVICWDDVIAA